VKGYPHKYKMICCSFEFYELEKWINRMYTKENLRLISVDNGVYFFENLDYKE